MKAFAVSFRAVFDVRRLHADTAAEALAMADRAVELDRNSDYAFQTRGLLALHLRGDCAAALADAERALAISPGYGLALQLKGEALIYSGELDEGMALIGKTIAFDPRDPTNFMRYWMLAMGHFLAGDYAAALGAVERAQQGVLDMPVQELTKAATLTKLGRVGAAREVVGRICARWPDATVGAVHQPLYRSASARREYLDALRAAGLPD